ncbi:MAG: thiamine biosynthesis protein ThiC [Pseudomonadota bacterium]
MDLSQSRTISILAILLLLAAISQPVYTALYLAAPAFDRLFLWGFEGLVFVLMAAFAGSALVMAKRYFLGFSAIAFSAVLNVVQVGVGLTQFAPFRDAAQLNPDLGPAALSVVAFSFFGYNAAKILLGLAALDFGVAKIRTGGKVLGSLTALIGVIAVVANTLVMMFGRDGFLPSPIAGASGVLATLLLAICLFSLRKHADEGSQSPLS